MTSSPVRLRFHLRDEQREIWQNLKRFNVLVCHRRFGKTVMVVMRLIEQALTCKKPRPQFALIAPDIQTGRADRMALYARIWR